MKDLILQLHIKQFNGKHTFKYHMLWKIKKFTYGKRRRCIPRFEAASFLKPNDREN